jgi:integrase
MPRKHRRGAVTLPKGVHRVVSRGREYFYFQAGRGTVAEGPRAVLPKDPHSPEFWIELRKAQGDPMGPAIATLNSVCDLYEASPHFLGLGSETQRQYRRGIAVARKAWGNLPADGVRPKHVRELLDGLAAIPGTANNVLGLLRALSKWGLERGHFDHSITEGVKPYKSTGGHKPWTAAQCAAAEKHLTGMIRRAYYLARYTGQRGSDVVRLGETYIDDGGFRISQKKTGREIWCPIDPALAVEIATWDRKPGPYLRQSHGRIYGKKLLESHFAEARAHMNWPARRSMACGGRGWWSCGRAVAPRSRSKTRSACRPP